jgi:LPPG:FO 2-phospho-L-lactate transferase
MALNRIVVLIGGVGGAKLGLGLARILPAESLTFIVNTGDDMTYYGLRICPDIDTLLYTLSGRVDPINGWGVAGDTRQMLETLRSYGEMPWFGLGDKDIATHLLRTSMLNQGKRLTEVIAYLAQGMGVAPRVLPMADEPVPTMIETLEEGTLAFQEYFVKHRWQPTVKMIRHGNAEHATLSPEVAQAIAEADAIIIAPSNPWLSIAPILAVPSMREALLARDVPRVAVTPIVKGMAIKGPTAKIMTELGLEVTAESVAAYYGPLLTGFISDAQDIFLDLKGLRSAAFDTMMPDEARKIALARELLEWLEGQ